MHSPRDDGRQTFSGVPIVANACDLTDGSVVKSEMKRAALSGFRRRGRILLVFPVIYAD
jgi:hypothetical protein